MSAESKPWKRLADTPVPTVWRRFEGRRPMADGKRPRFVIQDATPELYEAIVDHMATNFLRDEPVCTVLNASSEPASVRDFSRLWRLMLAQSTVLVALAEDDNGVTTCIAGANMTSPECLADKEKKEEFEGAAARRAFAAYDYTKSLVKPDVFTRYGVDCYLTALGLCVAPEYRGQGVGDQLLKARWGLCRALGIPLTVTWFTATASQVLAERIGFETLVEVPYAEYDDPDLKKCSTLTTKLMAARITLVDSSDRSPVFTLS